MPPSRAKMLRVDAGARAGQGLGPAVGGRFGGVHVRLLLGPGVSGTVSEGKFSRFVHYGRREDRPRLGRRTGRERGGLSTRRWRTSRNSSANRKCGGATSTWWLRGGKFPMDGTGLYDVLHPDEGVGTGQRSDVLQRRLGRSADRDGRQPETDLEPAALRRIAASVVRRTITIWRSCTASGRRSASGSRRRRFWRTPNRSGATGTGSTLC